MSSGSHFYSDVDNVVVVGVAKIIAIAQLKLIRGLVQKSAKEHRRVNTRAVGCVCREVKGVRKIVRAVEPVSVIEGQ